MGRGRRVKYQKGRARKREIGNRQTDTLGKEMERTQRENKREGDR